MLHELLSLPVVETKVRIDDWACADTAGSVTASASANAMKIVCFMGCWGTEKTPSMTSVSSDPLNIRHGNTTDQIGTKDWLRCIQMRARHLCTAGEQHHQRDCITCQLHGSLH
jgi:hypothetical protein